MESVLALRDQEIRMFPVAGSGVQSEAESVFRADENGHAKFQHSFKPGLQMSDVWTTAMLAINYHSDGKTYGALPGNFGLNAHVPLFVMLPPRKGLK